MNRKTRDDARAQVNHGKFSSLAGNPTREYLEALRQDLYTWIGEVDQALAELDQREAMPEDYEQCGYCGFDHDYEPNQAHKWHTEHHGEGYDHTWWRAEDGL